MFQDPETSQRYIRRRKSRKSSSMMMFVMAAALLITGGAFGTPWLTGLFSDDSHVSSANEAGVICPGTLVGLTLISDGVVRASGDLFELECDYVLSPSTTVSAHVEVAWAENGPNELLQRGCGLPPASVPGVFTAEGSHYGIRGQVRAGYSGQTRYTSAMRALSSELVAAASTIAEPCPSQTPASDIGPIGSSGNEGTDGSGSGSQGQPTGPGSTGTGGGSGSGQQGTETGGTGTGSPVGTLVPGSSTGSGQQDGEVVAAADVPESSCLVRGRITDSKGIAVPLVRVSVHDSAGGLISTSASGIAGSYSFGQPVGITGSVVLTPTDGGRAEPVFRIFAEQAPATLERQLSRVEAEGGICEVNFDIWDLDDKYRAVDSAIERWPSIIELYQNFNRAAELAVQLEAPLGYGLPVPVYAWCDSSELFCDPTGVAEFAFYSGSTTGRTVEQPYIALGFPSSELDYRGTPDNREYHEFGHAFLADVFNDVIPVNAGDQNHGGYFRNLKTTDSFIEGFSEFYSVMVTKHVEKADNPQRYKIGAEYDIEADRKPWEAVGWWEEFTLAGLLLDFEDGSADYVSTSGGLNVETVSALNADTGNFAIGRVRNLGDKVAHSPEVTVSLLDGSGNAVFTQVTAVKPDSLGPGQTGVFYVAAPDGIEFSEVDASPGRPAGADDDEIDLDLRDLMRVVTSEWGAGAGRIATALELYTALSDAFAGKDMDRDGVIDATQQQIDAIFIKHGFFDDIDGDRTWNPASDGEVGGSAHPASNVARNEFPEIMPRSSAVGFEGSFVAVDTAGVDADLLVQVELANSGDSYAYWTNSGTLSPVELAVPSASGEMAAVTVIATADGRNPAVAYRTSAQQFHAAVESGEIQREPVRSSIEMEPGDPLALLGAPHGGGQAGPGGSSAESSRAGGPPWAMLLPVALALLMLGGGIYLMRRTGTQATTGRRED